jgi:PAS domain S-box-containing protein
MSELIEADPGSVPAAPSSRIDSLLPAIFATVADGVTVLDRSGTVLFANDSAARMMGMESAADVIGRSSKSLTDAFELLDDDGEPFDLAEMPTRRAWAGEPEPEAVIRFRSRGHNEDRWSLVRARLLEGERSEADLVVTSFQDITRLVLEAQDAVRVRDEFMAIASHDMRTPLAAVRGYAQLARRHLIDEPHDLQAIDRWLADIDESAGRLTGLVSEFMDISLLHGGNAVPLQLQRVDLVELVTERVREHQGSEQQTHIFGVSSDATEIIGFWDPVRLGRVVDNVLGNAVKFSPGGTRVEIRLWTEDRYGCVAVVDEGIGIAERDQELIFGPMFRASNARGVAGTGLGLAGSRGIVGLMGGEISVDSKLGKGSTFTIRLPLDPVAIAVGAESSAKGVASRSGPTGRRR